MLNTPPVVCVYSPYIHASSQHAGRPLLSGNPHVTEQNMAMHAAATNQVDADWAYLLQTKSWSHNVPNLHMDLFAPAHLSPTSKPAVTSRIFGVTVYMCAFWVLVYVYDRIIYDCNYFGPKQLSSTFKSVVTNRIFGVTVHMCVCFECLCERIIYDCIYFDHERW